MAKFRNIVRGTQARKVVSLSLAGVEEPVLVALVPLLFEDQADAIAGAVAFAESKGSKAAKEGDPLYEQGLMLYTVLRASVDQESPADKPEPFFANEQEIRTSLDPERVALLFHQQRAWQDECAPSPRGMQPEDFAKIFLSIQTAGEGEEVPFDSLPRSTRQAFLRSMVKLLSNVLQLNLLLGSQSPAVTSAFASTAVSSDPEKAPSTTTDTQVRMTGPEPTEAPAPKKKPGAKGGGA